MIGKEYIHRLQKLAIHTDQDCTTLLNTLLYRKSYSIEPLGSQLKEMGQLGAIKGA